MTNYKEAGVDIDTANEGLRKIKSHVSSTYNKYTLSDVGSFGGCFNLPINEYKNPVEFFRRTYLTESLKQMLVGAVRPCRWCSSPMS